MPLTVAVLAVRGEYDLDNAVPLRRRLEEAAAAHDAIVLEASGVTFADSTFLTVLLRINLRTPLRVAAASRQVERLLTITGVDQVLGLHPTVREAYEAAVRGVGPDGAGT
ncbi:STAS domain-containing protein [uncultured Streptomyces sp.]|uniref:STAS domain-containing protein n=1 Tax=uncultured Streptomyces sp. TaxID=174707 RepID=UPI0026048BAE|nr:STAS domain-containing protein [uncultured Streptomyces sp.]